MPPGECRVQGVTPSMMKSILLPDRILPGRIHGFSQDCFKILRKVVAPKDARAARLGGPEKRGVGGRECAREKWEGKERAVVPGRGWGRSNTSNEARGDREDERRLAAL